MIKNYIIENKKYLIILLSVQMLLYFILFRNYIFNNIPYVFDDIGNDIQRAYIPTYYYYYDMLKDGFSFWSMRMGLGTSFLSHADIMFDPFTYILFLGGRANISNLIVYMVVLKAIFSGLFSYMYFVCLKLNKKGCILAALSYSLGGYFLIMGQNFVFSTIYVYMPLLLIGVEVFLKKREMKFLMIMLLLTCIYFYYFFYMVGILIVLYIIVRFYLNCESDYKKLIKDLLLLAFMGITTILISAFVVLPSLEMTNSSVRLDNNLTFSWSMFKPNFDALLTSIGRFFSNDIFGKQFSYYGYNRDYFELSLHTSIISIILLPQIYVNLDKQKRKKFIVIIIFVLMCLALPIFSSLMNAFTTITYRWTFFLHMLIALSVAVGFDLIDKKLVNKKALIITSVLSILLFIFTVFWGENKCSDLLSLDINSAIVSYVKALWKVKYLIFTIIIIILSYTFTLYNKMKFRYILMLMFAELLLINFDIINNRTVVYSTENGYFDDSYDYIQNLKKEDSSFYRLDKSFDSMMSQNNTVVSNNDAMVQGYYGLKNYNSNAQPNYIRFLQALDIYVKFPLEEVAGRKPTEFTGATLNYINGVDNRNTLKSYLGVKYYLTYNRELLPENFELVDMYKDILVYKNRNAFPLALIKKDFISYNDFMELSTETKDKVILKYNIVDMNDETANKFNNQMDFTSMSNINISDIDEKELSYFYNKKIQIQEFSEDYISLLVDADTSSSLVFTIPYEKGWKATVDGVQVQTYLSDLGMTTIKLADGKHSVKLWFTPYRWKTGMLISGLTIVFLSISFLSIKREKKLLQGMINKMARIVGKST